MLERARAIPNIEWVTPYVVDKLTNLEGAHGPARGRAPAQHGDGSTRELPTAGAFIAIGHEPQSQLVVGQVELDENGYVVTQGRSTLTNLPGVFAAGDLVDHTYRQAITAAGIGCQAALDAEWYLRDAGPLAADAAAPRRQRHALATQVRRIRAAVGRPEVARRLIRRSSTARSPASRSSPRLTIAEHRVRVDAGADVRVDRVEDVLAVVGARHPGGHDRCGVAKPVAMFSPAFDQS